MDSLHASSGIAEYWGPYDLVCRFFKDLNSSAGIDLENIVYYKDETHYFVMSAKKHSLLYKGVLVQVTFTMTSDSFHKVTEYT